MSVRWCVDGRGAGEEGEREGGHDRDTDADGGCGEGGLDADQELGGGAGLLQEEAGGH